MRSIGWLSEKGGVGKSTCAVNVAVGLAKRGNRVLFVDVDPQANGSMILLGGGAAVAPNLFHVLTEDAPAEDCIVATTTPGLDLLPADGMLADANVILATELARERRLRLAMGSVGGYDFVVFDTSPQRSVLTINVLNTVEEVYCPVDPGIFAIAGLVKLQEAVGGVVRFLDNPTLKLCGLIMSKASRDNLSRETESQLRQTFGPLVMKTTIPASVKIGEAHARLMSVLDFAPGTPGAVAFEALTEEIANGTAERVGDGEHGAAEVDGRGRGGRGRRAAG